MQRIKARTPLVGMGLSMIGPALLEFGTDEQKAEHLRRLPLGRSGGARIREPNSGSDLASFRPERSLMVTNT